MLLKRFFLEQLEREADASRKVVERVPEGQNAWKPHDRSMELGYLTALVATMPGWPALMIERDELDLNDPSGTFRTKPMETRAGLLRALDEGLNSSRRALEATTEQHMMSCWQLKAGDQVLTEGLRYKMIADGALSHLAHHRGQLTVYLRLMEAKVPAIYGPSADEFH
ncbi:MAG: DinB family protein [Acidobacteriaceae bacterium]|jgi:uncharacterized damage-inducible protein DinB